MSADDNAPEQAREVEVVRGVLRDHGLEQGGGGLHSWRCDHPDRYGECDCLNELVADLNKALGVWDRAAERQEAARAAWDDGYFHGWDDESFEERGKTPNPYRADGVTGWSGT